MHVCGPLSNRVVSKTLYRVFGSIAISGVASYLLCPALLAAWYMACYFCHSSFAGIRTNLRVTCVKTELHLPIKLPL